MDLESLEGRVKDEDGGPQLMPLETPLLRVSRPVAACSRCRAAKIRCDGKLPVCTACEKSNKAQECSSTNDQFARGKERSYVATLEAKVEKLQKKIEEVRIRRKSSITMLESPSTFSPVPLTPTATQSTARNQRIAKRKELASIDELVENLGAMAIAATARDFHGFSATMSYAKLILASSSKDPLPTGLKKELPPRHQASVLIQQYLEHIQSLIPILDETNFYASVAAVYDPEPRKAVPWDHWQVRIVLAIASAGQSQQRGDTLYSDAIGHICAAIEHAERVIHPGAIWSIQAMLLLVVYALVDPHHFDSWALIGAAARAAVDIGLHQEPSKTSQTPRVQIDLRRRVFQCLFSLDRSTSMVQTRSFSFSDDSATVALPYTDKVRSPPTSPSGNKVFWAQSHEPALAIFKLRRIQSAWYTELFQSGREPLLDPYATIWKAYFEMSKWFEDLPKSLTPTIHEYFELELLYSYTYLLSPNPRCPDPSEHAQRLVFENCVVYSSQMLHVTTDTATKRTPFTFYDAIRVYTTARTFVDILTKNGERILNTRSVATPGTEISDFNDLDPLAPIPTAKAPAIPIPSRHPSITSRASVDFSTPTHRAIAAINDFISVLSYFGRRFGYVGGISWRDRFQRESQDILQQLQQRLIQQQQMDQGFCVWNGPSTPIGAASSPQPPQSNPASLSRHSSTNYMGPEATTNPNLNNLVYPSPPYSHHSPDYVTQPISMTPSLNADWTNSALSVSPMANMQQQMVAQQSQQINTNFNMAQMSQDFQVMAPLSAGDLGLGQLTAWETLPGGPLNARFG